MGKIELNAAHFSTAVSAFHVSVCQCVCRLELQKTALCVIYTP